MSGTSLTQQVRSVWATPDCNTSTYSNGKMGPNIREQAAQWSTPNVCSPNSMRGNPQDPAKRKAAGHQSNLQDVAGYWKPEFSPQAQPTQHGLESSSTGPTSPRRLNPAFTEFLMGWSIGWTIAAPSASSAAATASFRLKLATLPASSLPELKGLFDEKM